MSNNILLIQVPETDVNKLRELRDYILESLSQGVLVLPEDANCEVMELPILGDIKLESEVEAPISSPPEPDTPVPTTSEAEEKRAIVQRLKDYRAVHGAGCLAAVSAKTARRKDRRISDDVLWHICADGAPKMPIEDWRSIAKALDALESDVSGKREAKR